MQPRNEIDCNFFLCTFTALYYFPFSANGLACFLNKCDVVYVRKYTQDIQTSDFLYVGAATAAAAARRGWYLLTTHAHC